MRSLFDLAVSWGPMLLLIGVWIYFMRRSGGMKQGQYFEQVRAYMSEHIAETKRPMQTSNASPRCLRHENTQGRPMGPNPFQ